MARGLGPPLADPDQRARRDGHDRRARAQWRAQARARPAAGLLLLSLTDRPIFAVDKYRKNHWKKIKENEKQRLMNWEFLKELYIEK